MRAQHGASYIGVLKEYWGSVTRALGSKLNSDDRKKLLIEARKECINGLVDLIDEASKSLSGLLGLEHALAGCVVVDARLVYRGRPGSGSFLLPLEWGLLVHPVFLVPYFPGSAVKGAMRTAYMELVCGETDCGDEACKRCVEALFGAAGGAGHVGCVSVYDAYPVRPGSLGFVVGDVLTPHVRAGDRSYVCSSDAEPVPVQGISVAEGTVFRFTACPCLDKWCLKELRGCPGVEGDPDRMRSLVAGLLVYALQRVGLGGKTTRGYGFFQIEKLMLKER